MELAAKVRTRREELGLSQEELAYKMGYKSRTSINKIEMGRPVSQKIIARLSEVLDVPIYYLMDLETEKAATLSDDGYSEKKKNLLKAVEQMTEEQAELLLSLWEQFKAGR